MLSRWDKRFVLFAVCLAAGLIVAAPLLVASPAADALFHYTLIKCFADQFWQGDLYPRWCMAANDGLGSPLFIFYFPLPYYITSLFYPLVAGAEQAYDLSMMLATMVTFLTCRLWLRDVVSPGRAVLASLLFLLMPYRMEVLYFRTAFAEAWCMAFLSLLFLYTRRIALGDKKSWVMMALSVVLCITTHAPLTYIALLGCGLQLVLMTGWKPKAWIPFILAGIVSCMMLGIYLAPAAYYMQYLSPQLLEFVRSVWVNNYASMDELRNFTRATFNRSSIMVNLGIMLVFLLAMAMVVMRRRGEITDATISRETKAWCATALLALFLMFPISAPVWDLFYALSGIRTPWRAQVLIPFVIVYLLAVKTQWLMSPKQLKTWRCDFGAMMVLFMILGLSVLTTHPPEVLSLYKVAIDSMVVNAMEYRSQWTAEPVANRENIIERFQKKDKPARASVEAGKGSVTIQSWDCCLITLDVKMKKDGILHLEHFYFPIWRVRVDGVINEGLYPQEHTGFMQLALPKGEHHITMKRSLLHAMGLYYQLAALASLTGWLLWGIFFYRYRRHYAG